MNKIEIFGHITADPVLRYSQAEMANVQFSVAVNRWNKNGDQTADFFRCKAFGDRAQMIAKNFRKGSPVLIVGHVQTGSYERGGQKIPTFDIVIEEIFFTAPRQTDADAPEDRQEARGDAKAPEVAQSNTQTGFEPLTAEEEADLPF